MISVSCLELVGSYSYVCLSSVIVRCCDVSFINYALCQAFPVSWAVFALSAVAEFFETTRDLKSGRVLKTTKNSTIYIYVYIHIYIFIYLYMYMYIILSLFGIKKLRFMSKLSALLG